MFVVLFQNSIFLKYILFSHTGNPNIDTQLLTVKANLAPVVDIKSLNVVCKYSTKSDILLVCVGGGLYMTQCVFVCVCERF